MDLNLCRNGVPFEILRQSGNRLQFLERAVFGIIVKHGNSGVQFVDDVSVTAIRVKCQMPRARTGLGRHEGRIVWSEGSAGGVKFANKGFVQAKVAGESETVGSIEDHAMGMRALLATRVDALAGILNKGGVFAESTIRQHREHRQAATSVIRDEDIPVRGIQYYVAGAAANGGVLIYGRQSSRFRVDGKSADGPGPFAVVAANFICRKKVPTFGVDGQESGIRSLSGQSKGIQSSGGQVHAGGINALTFCAAVGADKKQALAISC